jgi:hypothetical protein
MAEKKDWDSPIDENGSTPNAVLPQGEYRFVVKSLVKTVSKGAKTSGAPQAKMVLMIYDKNDETYANQIGIAIDRLTLHTETWGMVCQFFKAIGERKHGETIQPNWEEVPGASGLVKLSPHTFEGKTHMQVDAYIDPAGQQEPAKPDFD